MKRNEAVWLLVSLVPPIHRGDKHGVEGQGNLRGRTDDRGPQNRRAAHGGAALCLYGWKILCLVREGCRQALVPEPAEESCGGNHGGRPPVSLQCASGDGRGSAKADSYPARFTAPDGPRGVRNCSGKIA